jgi:hypothetical protein
MIRILQSFLLILILISSLSFTFQKDDNKVYWDLNRPLVWADFKGKPDNSTGNVAFTFSRMDFGYSYISDSATITLNRFFEKNKSWVKEKGRNDYVLKHEQGHFDLTEIFYRKLVKEIQGYKFHAKTFNAEFSKLTNTNSDDLNKEQDLYDKETNHSIIEPKQKEWNEKIALQLKEFEPYQATKIVVHL